MHVVTGARYSQNQNVDLGGRGDPLSIHEIIGLACEEDVETAYTKVIDYLEDFTAVERTLSSSVKNFIEMYFPRAVFQCLSGNEPTKGISGAAVYKIQVNGKLAYAKAFQKHTKEKEFVEELRAISTLKKLKLKSSHRVKALYAGKCTVNGKTVPLLIQSAADGEGFDDHLKQFFGLQEPFLQSERLKIMQRLLQMTAQAFAELHFETRQDITPSFAEGKTLEAIQDIANKLNDNGRVIVNAQKIEQIWEALFKEKRYSVITHGDGHPGNIFAKIEKTCCKITFIDVSSLDRARCANSSLLGCMPPEQDFAKFIVWAKEIYIKETLPDKTTNMKLFDELLTQEFETAYSEYTGPNFLSSTSQQFQMVRILLGRIHHYKKNVLPELSQSQGSFKITTELVQKLLETQMLLLKEVLNV